MEWGLQFLREVVSGSAHSTQRKQCIPASEPNSPPDFPAILRRVSGCMHCVAFFRSPISILHVYVCLYVGMYSIYVYLYSGASKTFVRGAWERDHASPSSRTSSPLQKHSLFGATSMPRGTEPSRPLKTLKFFVRSQRVQGACDEVEFCRFCQRHTFSRPPLPPFVVFRKAGVHHASFVDDEGGGPSE